MSTPKQTNPPLERLRHHVTGAIERGEAQAIAGRPAPTHTPEPLRYHLGRGENPRFHIQTVGGYQIASTPELVRHKQAYDENAQKEANAKRIVETWNACQSIPNPSAIPAMVEALIEALPWVEAQLDDPVNKPGTVRAVAERIRAALAAMEGTR